MEIILDQEPVKDYFYCVQYHSDDALADTSLCVLSVNLEYASFAVKACTHWVFKCAHP